MYQIIAKLIIDGETVYNHIGFEDDLHRAQYIAQNYKNDMYLTDTEGTIKIIRLNF